MSDLSTASSRGEDGAAVAAVLLPDRLVTATRDTWRDAVLARADETIAVLAERGGRPELGLDLRDAVEIDATGLGLLVLVHKRARERGVAVRLLGTTPSIRELLSLTKLEQLFEFGE